MHHFDIHSADGNIIWLPDEKLLLAGDTLEDPITYISEAAHIATHIAELERMRTWPIDLILPSHGAEARITAGGYAPSLIDANRSYLERLADPTERAMAEKSSLREFVADDIASGAIGYFEPYEAVHRKNIEAVNAAAGEA